MRWCSRAGPNAPLGLAPLGLVRLVQARDGKVVIVLLRLVLCLVFWPVGIPYLLYRRGRTRWAFGLAVLFLSGSILSLSAIPWRNHDGGPFVPSSEEPGHKAPRASYKIIKDERLSGTTRNVQVRLAEKVSAAVLLSLAYEIRDLDPDRYPRIFIEYYLPEMSTERSAWATTHFTPELEVAIRGSTKEQDQQVTTR